MVKGHATEVFKDYDALRCVHCGKLIKVPHETLTFECPFCEGINEFIDVEIEDE